jgi:hypothetical protein
VPARPDGSFLGRDLKIPWLARIFAKGEVTRQCIDRLPKWDDAAFLEGSVRNPDWYKSACSHDREQSRGLLPHRRELKRIGRKGEKKENIRLLW